MPGSIYRVTASALNIRSSPSLSSGAVGAFPLGAKVTSDGLSADQMWFHVSTDGLEGWCYGKYLEPVAPEGAGAFPWIPIALAELGQAEVPGPGSNPRIVEYLRSTSLNRTEASRDETAWCSAFVNWCVERAGFAGTDSAWALNWQHWGRPSDPPRIGCITVITRDPDCGHVGFYLGEKLVEGARRVTLLGGNQGNRVCAADFPRERVVAFREPIV
jgi:uncharacterized protein (TIGR02594 family)